MLTPQEVSSRAFPKSVVGGYNMTLVDEFLDELTEDYTALYKENAALKGKMKLLVDKVEEYRATEDSMRAALLAAQKMANTMVEDAEKRKADLLANAEDEARRKIAGLQDEVAREQRRLDAAKAETAAFVAQVRDICQHELALLDALPDLSLQEQPAPADEVNSDEIEAQILASFRSEEEAAPPVPADEPAPAPAQEDTARMPFLSELKFGRNYHGEEDD